MKALTPETRVGLFTIAAGIALLYLSLRTAGVSLFGMEEAFFFNMNFDSVAGVELRSKVKLSGVEIGYIENIILEEGYATIKARLVREATIRKNAIATIRTSGLLGEQYIEIIQGTQDQPPLKDGETLENTREPADISDIISKIGEAMDDVKSVTASLKSIFGALEGEQALKNILKNIDEASASMKTLLAENRKSLKITLDNLSIISTEFAKSTPAMAENLEKISVGLMEIIENNRENLTEGIANMRYLTAQFRDILKENRENLKITLENVATASSKIDEIMEFVKTTSQSFAKVTDKIERGEGTIGKLMTEEDVYDNLNKTLSGASKFLNKAEDLRLSLGFRAERQFELEEIKAFFSLKLQPREDKYYLVEVSEDLRREDDLTTTRNTLNSLLYTVLIAKRFSDVTLRGGLIESSTGAGLDLHIFNDRLMASADIFNIGGYDGNTDNAQLKARLRWNPHKYIYFYLGGDELLNEFYRTFLAGAGIMFDEDDLKMAFGLSRF